MKRFLFLLLVGLLSSNLIAQESVTVTANSEDIANNLDLNLVASLFGQASNVEEFEVILNNPDSAFSNLDLNGDGQVDYLRVVESFDENRRLVIIQAVLAQDIFQDVASIYLEKDASTNEVSAQVIGDKFIYGDNYIITPVYLYRPVIYSWLWSSIYMPYCSPWYWGHYPLYWRHWHCITYHDYWRRCYYWHHHHHYCSFHHHHHPHHGYHDMYHRSGMGRHDYATHHPDQSYESRSGSSGVYRRVNESVRSRSSSDSSDNQFGSSSVRGRSQTSESSGRVVSTSRTSMSSQRIQSTSRTSSSSGRSTGVQRTRSTSVSRSTGGQTGGQRIHQSSASSSRSSASSRTSSASSSRTSGGGSVSRSSTSGGSPRTSGGSYRSSASSSRQSTGPSRSSGSRSGSSSSGGHRR